MRRRANPAWIRSSDVAGGRLPAWAARLFDGVQPAIAMSVLDASTHVHIPSGAPLFAAPDTPRSVSLVTRGTLRLHIGEAPGTIALSLAGPGDLVGDVAALSGRRALTAVAVEPCDAFVMAGDAFEDALGRVPRLGLNVARSIAAQLDEAHGTILALTTMEVDRRVARQLLAFADRYGTLTGDGSVRLPLRIRQQDLAWLVGASRERTNRALVAFRERGWIAAGADSRLRLVRPDLLAKRAGEAVSCRALSAGGRPVGRASGGTPDPT